LNNLILQIDILTIGPIIGVIIGAIIGAFAAYCFAILIENRRERSERRREIEFRKRIASIITQELQTYHNFLDNQLAIFQHVQSNDSRALLEYRASFFDHLNGLPRDYINMPAEIKAKVFDVNTLTTLGKVYQFIQEFNPNLQPGKFEGSINLLIHDIKKGLESIQKMKID
jgi:hypothetical protein